MEKNLTISDGKEQNCSIAKQYQIWNGGAISNYITLQICDKKFEQLLVFE